MAAGAWKIYKRAKKYIGAGTITLGAGVFRMSLHRASASAAILVLSTRSTKASIVGEISATGGYALGGKTLPPATGQWTLVAGGVTIKFTYTTAGLVFTASGASLSNIKYALIQFASGASQGTAKTLCFCTLSSSAFTITSPNTLTILPAATGVFTLA